MRIYTRTGDTGETGLYGGSRVSKTDLRVEAYGTVDEANAALGMAAVWLAGDLRETVSELQSLCFEMGADLATPIDVGAGTRIRRIALEDIELLEAAIDRWEARSPALRTFILPGGSRGAAALHVARTVVRRAERRCWSAVDDAGEGMNPLVARALNRMGDLLFVLARAANAEAGVEDVAWVPRVAPQGKV
ncbi:MAG: cob(I)yrinic acid a,c-diamide adenosyltransferase [Armatimonadota bacterium]